MGEKSEKRDGCRFCGTELNHVFLDLGHMPPANAFLTKEQLREPEHYYPLNAMVCGDCHLVQVGDDIPPGSIFNERYAYFSSASKTIVENARNYANMVKKRFNLGANSEVFEVASNDGYCLQHFKSLGIPCTGIEPASDTAEEARKKGIETIEKFFDERLAWELREQGKRADLLIGNNVLAHVPEPNTFIRGLEVLLADNGVITMEFPHFMNLVRGKEFDTIYHEHFSNFTFHTVKRMFERQGLELFDVDQLPVHGGSLRIYAKHKSNSTHDISEHIAQMLKIEEDEGMTNLDYYTGFAQRANIDGIRDELISFLVKQKMDKKLVYGCGAAAKGNTLLNFCRIGPHLLPAITDNIPYKQGKYAPGSHIPISPEEKIREAKPDYLFIIPWNHKEEMVKNLEYCRQWGAKFVTAIPRLEIW